MHPTTDAREAKLKALTEQFPDAPMGWFSWGRYLVEVGRFEPAITALEKALSIDPAYAAAWMSLGDALAAIEEKERARTAYGSCARAAMAQNHPSLAKEANERAEEL